MSKKGARKTGGGGSSRRAKDSERAKHLPTAPKRWKGCGYEDTRYASKGQKDN